jgi:hypothetical protein
MTGRTTEGMEDRGLFCRLESKPALPAALEKFDLELFILNNLCFSSDGSNGRPSTKAFADAGFWSIFVKVTRHNKSGSVFNFSFIFILGGVILDLFSPGKARELNECISSV